MGQDQDGNNRMNNKVREPRLGIIVPCFNEEEVLNETCKELTAIIETLIHKNKIRSDSFVLFVDDGSSDATWQLIEHDAATNRYVRGLKLSRNFGHQNALIAGMDTAAPAVDCCITIDADLQDDVRAIEPFIDQYHQGCDIVYGVRKSRKTDTFFKKNTALAFYRLMNRMGVHLIPNHADYRLMSKRAMNELANYREENLFLRGIVPLLGFRSAKVYYDRRPRLAGQSKYPLKKMIAFAIDGITSFSIVPIKLVMSLGFLLVLIGIGIGIYAFVGWLLGHTISGWTSLILSIWLVGGMQLVAIGVIGEYIGKIFKETKKRPRYTIERDTWASRRETENHE
jgi:glycosyltransferase involved in cell wall biosynthesis